MGPNLTPRFQKPLHDPLLHAEIYRSRSSPSWTQTTPQAGSPSPQGYVARAPTGAADGRLSPTISRHCLASSATSSSSPMHVLIFDAAVNDMMYMSSLPSFTAHKKRSQRLLSFSWCPWGRIILVSFSAVANVTWSTAGINAHAVSAEANIWIIFLHRDFAGLNPPPSSVSLGHAQSAHPKRVLFSDTLCWILNVLDSIIVT